MSLRPLRREIAPTRALGEEERDRSPSSRRVNDGRTEHVPLSSGSPPNPDEMVQSCKVLPRSSGNAFGERRHVVHAEQSTHAGATREQMVDHLTQRLNPSTWDLIRHGVLSNVFYKVGNEPGFFAVLSASIP